MALKSKWALNSTWALNGTWALKSTWDQFGLLTAHLISIIIYFMSTFSNLTEIFLKIRFTIGQTLNDTFSNCRFQINFRFTTSIITSEKLTNNNLLTKLRAVYHYLYQNDIIHDRLAFKMHLHFLHSSSSNQNTLRWPSLLFPQPYFQI